MKKLDHVFEVIATTVNDAVIAAQHGADRIELITAIGEGGLTPSLGLIEEVVRAVSIPVNVMLRPHSRTFIYNAEDLRTMLADVRYIRDTGANALVFGALTPQRLVDTASLERVLEAAEGLPMTFHRAIDEARSVHEAIETLLHYPQITTVLTSGGKPSALEGETDIATMVRRTEQTQLAVLAGSGLSLESMSTFIAATSVQQVHVGSAVRVNGNPLAPIDAARMQKLNEVVRQAWA
ncbi:copper homeostasis protein CutC [Paenibacillus sp. 481]|uniref:copper homeostasis protein CutC n=1 Tax=Paenibacillus sp. 481 TaxID=2835869 RepID=UPI001E44B950|nr:copper homeostasis protein CutC [Paenibacillus sp. 481]UHA74762.1 copper homeostasis protein CutC [Paenibacillus sp. 481]